MYWLLLFTIGFLVWLILGRLIFFVSLDKMMYETMYFYLYLFFFMTVGWVLRKLGLCWVDDLLDALVSYMPYETSSRYHFCGFLLNSIVLLILFMTHLFNGESIQAFLAG